MQPQPAVSSPTARGNIGQSSARDAGSETLLACRGAAKHDCMPKAHDHMAMYQRIGMANSFQRILSTQSIHETRSRACGSPSRDTRITIFL